MCGRLLTTFLAVLATLVFGAGTAVALPVGWSITPGGPFTGAGGQVPSPVMCAGSNIAGRFTATGGNPLGFINSVTYRNCTWGAYSTEISPYSPWQLTGVSHSNGVTVMNITNIAAGVRGPGCAFHATGSAGASYDNATGILTVRHQNIVVDSVDGCLGLVSAGGYVSLLSSSYVLSPRQVFAPS